MALQNNPQWTSSRDHVAILVGILPHRIKALYKQLPWLESRHSSCGKILHFSYTVSPDTHLDFIASWVCTHGLACWNLPCRRRWAELTGHASDRASWLCTSDHKPAKKAFRLTMQHCLHGMAFKRPHEHAALAPAGTWKSQECPKILPT